MKHGVATGFLHEFVVGPIFHEPPRFNRDDAIGVADRREPVRNDEHGPSSGNLAHVALNDVFALIVERAGCLVEDKNSGIGDERAGNGDTLALPPKGSRRARQPSCCIRPAAQE